jgi:hypothetical protein
MWRGFDCGCRTIAELLPNVVHRRLTKGNVDGIAIVRGEAFLIPFISQTEVDAIHFGHVASLFDQPGKQTEAG